MQLCIDAGIPLDNGLIGELVENVIAEKVKSLLGYPKRSQPQPKKVDCLFRSVFCCAMVNIFSRELTMT